MQLTKDQMIASGLVGGAAVLGYVAWRRRSERMITCDEIANRAGGTMDDPCPTEGPVDICSHGDDYVPWVERLSIQITAVTQLQANMDDAGLLDQGWMGAFESYSKTATALVSQWPPAWTSKSNINPMLNQLRVGCDLLNQGNAVLVQAGRREYVVREPEETRAFAYTAQTGSGWRTLILVAGLATGVVIAKRRGFF